MLIVTGSDDNYVAGVMVLIASAALHTPSARFAVIDMGISPENRARIDQLSTRIGRPIKRIEVGEESFADMPLMDSHLTRATYLRLLIPDLFPDEDRAVYMDCDMVVLADMAGLSAVDLSGKLLAGVAETHAYEPELLATGHTSDTYINAGILLMNLSLWRSDGTARKCHELGQSRNLLFNDQSAINIVAKDRAIYLESGYNTYAILPGNCTRDYIERAIVLHFLDRGKPWMRKCNFDRIWWCYARPIKSLIPAMPKVPLKEKISHFNRRRKLFFRVLLRKQNYAPEIALYRFANTEFSDRCIANAKKLMAEQKLI